MILLDIILFVIIAGFGVYGFATGFVHTVLSLVGTMFSIVVAVNTYAVVSFWILPDIIANQFSAQVIVFFLILTIMSKLIQILIKVAGKAFNVISVIPFTKTLNRVLGVTVGLVEGVLISATLVFLLTIFPNLPEPIQSQLDSSTLAGTLMFISTVMVLMFPDAISRAQEIVTETIKK